MSGFQKGEIINITLKELNDLKKKGIVIRSEPIMEFRFDKRAVTCYWFEPLQYKGKVVMNDLKMISMFCDKKRNKK